MSYSRTVLITGGTSGLGYHTALNIAREHPEYQIILASRTDKDTAATKINTLLSQKNVTYLPLDLSSLANVRTFGQNWTTKSYPPITILLLNAGLQFPTALRKTADGIESTFAINHVGHALLFHLLYPHLSPDARIVLTSSGTHDPAQKSGLPDAIFTSAEALAHPTIETEKYDGRQRYASSKLANVLWTYALHRRLEKINSATSEEMKLTVVAFDPGLMPGSGLAREGTAFERFLWHRVLPRIIPLLRLLIHHNVHTPEESGSNLAWIACNEGTSGVYYEEKKQINSSVDSYVVEKQEDLWEWTVRNTARGEDEMGKFDIGK